MIQDSIFEDEEKGASVVIEEDPVSKRFQISGTLDFHRLIVPMPDETEESLQ